MGRHAAAGRVDHSERHQSAALRDAQGHHGGEEERNQEGAGARCGGEAEDRQPLRAGEGQEDTDDRRLASGCGERARAASARRRESPLMASSILVVAEQRDGKLNRATWETIAAAQQIAAGDPITVVVPGAATEAVANELAAAAVKEI